MHWARRDEGEEKGRLTRSSCRRIDRTSVVGVFDIPTVRESLRHVERKYVMCGSLLDLERDEARLESKKSQLCQSSRLQEAVGTKPGS